MEAKWCTYDGRKIPISKLDDQHLCNCYWFSKVMWGDPHYKVVEEVEKRFGKKPLQWKPLPVPNEINWLREKGLIDGEDIILDGKKIGTISHINPMQQI